MHSKFLFSLWVLLLPWLAQAAAPKHAILSRYFVTQTTAMPAIARKFEVEKRWGAGFVVIVPAAQASELIQLAPQSQLLDADIAKTLHEKVARQAGWHSFDSVQTDLQSLAAAYPGLVTVDQYGASQENHPLKVLRIFSKVKTGRTKPQLVITAATHGDELITVEVWFGLVNALLQGYGKDARLTKIVDDHELFFIPVINPDGYILQERYCDGIDPNRDYPYPSDPSHTSNPAIKAVMDFFAAHDIKGSMDYHSAAGMIMYPWAYTLDPVPSPDKEDFDQLTSKMAEVNGYQHGQIAETIYVAPGSSADYYYWKFHSKSLGIEISQDGSPSLISSMLNENLESTWRFIESF